MATILIVVQGTEGDIRPMVRIGMALSARGHSVTVLTHAVFEARVRRAGLAHAALDTVGEYERLMLDSMRTLTVSGMFERFQRQGLPQLPAQYELIRQHHRPHETLLLAHTNSQLIAAIAAESLRIPIALVFLAPAYMAMRPITEQILGSTFGPLVNQVRARFDLPPVYDWGAWWQDAAHPVALWPDWFAPPEPGWPERVVQAGFLPVETDQAEALPLEAQAFLEAADAPVLITGGTGMFVGTEYFEACIEACRRLGRRSLLVARYQTFVPPQLPETVRLFEALPFTSLMPHLGAVIHHGGIGTLSQALAAGIPQVVLAKGFDRPDNAQRLERLGVGRFLPQPAWTADAVTKALEMMLTDRGVHVRCRELAGSMSTQDSLARVVSVLEAIDLHQPAPVADQRAYRPTSPIGRPETVDWEEAYLPSRLAELSPERLELLVDLLREKDSLEPEEAAPITVQAEQGLVTGPLPLSPNQCWFLGRDLPNPHYWNMSVLSEVAFPLQPALLVATVKALLEHHDVLRTRFVREPAGWRQSIAEPEADVPVTYFDLSALPAEQQLAVVEDVAPALQRSLDLTRGPLLRVAYFDCGAQPGRLVFIVHHLVSDTLSLQVLTQDCQTAYQQLSQGQALRLPAKTTSYKVWAEKLVAHVQSAELQQELNYWLGLPWDRVRPVPLDYPLRKDDNTIGSTQHVRGTLDAEETDALLHTLPRRYGVRALDVLLAAYGQTLAAWTGDPVLLLTLIISGRESPFVDIDLSRTVGLFALGIPTILEVGPAQSPEDTLFSVHEQLLRIPNQGITHGVLHRLSTPDVTEKMEALASRSELVFNYYNIGSTSAPSEPPPLRRLREAGSSEDPRHRRTCVLYSTAGVTDGCLWFNWEYSAPVHRRSTIERLAQRYAENLRALLFSEARMAR